MFLVHRNDLYFYSLQASIAAATAPPTRISNSEPRLPQPGTAAPDCKLASPVAVPVGLSVAPGVNTVMEVTVVTAPPGRVKVCVLVLEVGLAVGDGPLLVAVVMVGFGFGFVVGEGSVVDWPLLVAAAAAVVVV